MTAVSSSRRMFSELLAACYRIRWPLRAMVTLSLLGGSCLPTAEVDPPGTPPDKPPDPSWLIERTLVRTFMAEKGWNGPLDYVRATDDRHIRDEVTDADVVWSRWCRIAVEATSPFPDPVVFWDSAKDHGKWRVYGLAFGTHARDNPGARWWMDSVPKFPRDTSHVFVYVVDRVYGAQQPDGSHVLLLGAATTGNRFVWLTGAELKNERRVLAHELGHVFGNDHSIDPRDLMHETSSSGSNLGWIECGRARGSRFSQEVPYSQHLP